MIGLTRHNPACALDPSRIVAFRSAKAAPFRGAKGDGGNAVPRNRSNNFGPPSPLAPLPRPCFARCPGEGGHCWTATRPARRGIVLILVAAVIVMVSLAGLSFVMTMSSEDRLVHLHGEELQRAQAVASGVELLSVFVEQPEAIRAAAGGCWDNPQIFRGVVVVADDDPRYRVRFSAVAPRIENDEVTGVRFGAECESARLNLAMLAAWEARLPGAGVAALMNLPGMTPSTAAAIMDWLDADHVPRPGGAEADYYAGMHLPYAPRNGAPAALEELLLVRGVTRALLLGRDANANYQFEPGEGGGTSGSAGAALAWASLLTVASAERNADEHGRSRVNLNDSDIYRLYQDLAAAMDPRWAQFIVLYRQFGPYRGPLPDESQGVIALAGDGGQAGGPPPLRLTWRADRAPAGPPAEGQPGAGPPPAEASPQATLAMPARPVGRFRIASPLDLIGQTVRVPGPSRSAATFVASPFTPEPAAMRQYLPLLLDRTTLVREPVIVGRVNVNLAPRCVLRGVPGIDAALVERIVAARRPTSEDAAHRQPTWLLTEGLIDLEQMKALLPWLTCGGDVWRLQVVAGFEQGGPMQRAEVVLDATVAPPRQVYWKDLRLAGPGFSHDVLGGGGPTP